MVLFGSITTQLPLRFELYFSDRPGDNNLDYDCLNYHQIDALTKQVIPYCMRSYDENRSTNRGVPFTFQELRMGKVTSEQMLTWISVPIDLIERYQIYLNNPNAFSSSQIFYNCSSPYFGEYCQYTFNSTSNFSEIVDMTFHEKSQANGNPLGITIHTCYTHLRCDRGPAPSCLDYREICDGKIDCKDGQDEAFCSELETNECNENEYRCHNGLCIPNAFFQDDQLNPECSDKSDEIQLIRVNHYPHNCSQDPTFRCEETTCQNTQHIVCGDGQCNDQSACKNGRDVQLNRAIFSSLDYHDISFTCWQAMLCATGNNHYFENYQCPFCSDPDRAECLTVVRQNCPPIFQYPTNPIMFGHVYFAYRNTQSNASKIWMPEFVCYNELLCDFLPSTVMINNMSCRYFHELDLQINFNNWADMMTAVTTFFRTCLTRTESNNCQESPSLFQCGIKSSKCISKHRLMDGTIDCYDGIDERYTNSCNPGDSNHRFKCPSENKCIASFLVLDKMNHCVNGEDEIDPLRKQISFPTLCDGVLEKVIGEDTDETDCEYFPCSTQYTRCDGYWTCVDGTDEANCIGSICPPNTHVCLSPYTKNVSCLPLANVNDGIMHCLGGFDEPSYCLKANPLQHDRQFRCWNSAVCIPIPNICDALIHCPFGDDELEQLCDKLINCNSRIQGSPISSNQLLCHLQDRNKSKKKYFSLLPNAGASNAISQTTSKLKNDISNINLSPRQVWYCNRGILVYMSENREEKCLCPPSYYGDRCQYQNERVSITMKLQSIEWLSSFSLMLTLIDEDNRIHSREQINYQPMHDCGKKFNLYLLFASRPKVANKNYSVRIDAFEKNTLEYRVSWLYPILFPFLPVYRLAIDATIPTSKYKIQVNNCSFDCMHGHCARFENAPQEFFCRCDIGWSGPRCTIKYECNCSPDSLCLGSINNRSLCVCPPNKFGPRCLFTQSVCQLNTCMNDGQCIPVDEHNSMCLCKDGYSGSRCQLTDAKITITFSNTVNISKLIFVHFITVLDNAQPIRESVAKNNMCDQKSVTFYIANPFHLIFTEFLHNYYLNFLQEKYTPSTDISISIMSSHRCASIHELFNSTILALPSLRRIKYYHIPCQEQAQLPCFFDEAFMCLCNLDRQANCLEFDHNMTYDCTNVNNCHNKVRCLDENVSCSTTQVMDMNSTLPWTTSTARMISCSIIYQAMLYFLMLLS